MKPSAASVCDLLLSKKEVVTRIERLERLIITKALLAERSPRAHMFDLLGYRDDLAEARLDLVRVEAALEQASDAASPLAARELEPTARLLEAIDVEADDHQREPH